MVLTILIILIYFTKSRSWTIRDLKYNICKVVDEKEYVGTYNTII